MNGSGNWRRLVAALVVAIGVATAWITLVMWGGSIVSGLWQSPGRVYESVVVGLDGTPLIQTQSSTDYRDLAYRDLAGATVDVAREDWLQGASLPTAIKPPGLFHVPIGWGQVMGVSDGGRPPVAWYLIRDNRPHGHAYFVGYDERTKTPVGFIARGGFQRGLPPAVQWFDLGQHQLTWGSRAVASSTYLQFGTKGYYYGQASEEMRLPSWLVFLMDGRRLLEIDLRQRTVRTLHEADDVISVGVHAEVPAAAAEDNQQKPKQVRRVVIRTDDRLVVLDPPTGAQREFALPKSLREEGLTVYGLGSEELLVQWWARRERPVNLAWLKPDGTFARQERVVLASYPQPSERVGAWMAAGVAPILLGWLAVLGAIAPLGMIQANEAATYSDAFARVFAPGWPAFVALIVLSGALAWWTWRLQARYRRPATGAWSAFVFLLGVPGIIAYWFEHRRPRFETCGECGQVVPRDRDACAACEVPFPAPPPVGTEIFA